MGFFTCSQVFNLFPKVFALQKIFNCGSYKMWTFCPCSNFSFFFFKSFTFQVFLDLDILKLGLCYLVPIFNFFLQNFLKLKNPKFPHLIHAQNFFPLPFFEISFPTLNSRPSRQRASKRIFFLQLLPNYFFIFFLFFRSFP